MVPPDAVKEMLPKVTQIHPHGSRLRNRCLLVDGLGEAALTPLEHRVAPFPGCGTRFLRVLGLAEHREGQCLVL